MDTSVDIPNPRLGDVIKRPQKTSTLQILAREAQTSGSDGRRASSILTPSSNSSLSSPSLELISTIHRPFLGNGVPFRAVDDVSQPRSAEIRSGSSSSP